MEKSETKVASSWRWDVAVLGLFVVLTTIMTFPLFLRMGDTIDNWGDPLLNSWILSWDVHQSLRDPLHLFDANIFYPYSNALAFSESLLASALLVAPVNLLTGNAILAYNVLVFLSFVLSGFSAYLLGREVTGSRLAGFVGGFVFAFSMYRYGEFSHVQLLTAQWMPLVLLYLGRFLHAATYRTGLMFALFFSLQALSSFYYAFYIAIACALYLVFVAIPWIRHRAQPPQGILRKAVVVVGVIAIVVIPPTLPYFSVERDLGLYRTLEDTIDGSAALENYLAVPANNLYAQTVIPFVSRTKTEETFFPGLIAPVLGVLALVSLRKKRGLLVGYFTILVAIAFVLSLGPFLKINIIEGKPPFWFSLPYGFLYDYVPGFKSMRVPARFEILILLGTSGLAAMGMSRLLSMVRGRLWISVVGLVCLLLTFEYYSAPVRTTPIEVGNNIPQVYRWLATLSDGGAVFEYPTMESTFPPKVEEMERLGYYQYMSTFHWHPTINGYSGFIPPLFYEVREEAKNFPDATSVSLFRGMGVKYIVFHTAEIEPGKWEEIKRRLSAVEADFQPVATFGSDVVFLLDPGRGKGKLQTDVFLPASSGNDGNYQAYLRVLNTGDAAVTYKAETGLAFKVGWTGEGKTLQDDAVRIKLPLFFPKGLTVLPVPVEPPPAGDYQLSISSIGNDLKVAGTGTVDVASSPSLVSGTSQVQTKGQLQVTGLDVEPKGYRPGEVLPVHVKWRTPSILTKDYTLFVKLVDGSNKAVAGVEAEPLQGNFPTTQWKPGEVIDDLYAIDIPPSVPAGRYQVMLGAYDFTDGSEPQLLDVNGKPVERIVVGSIRVTGNDGHLSTDSGANMQRVDAVLGDSIVLRGYSVNGPAPRPGGVLDVTLYWEALKTMDVDYTGFIHVLNSNGQPVAQIDGQPAGGRFPTSIWEPGDVVPDERQIKMPASLPPGRYQLKAGLYLLPGPTPLFVQNMRDKDDGNRVYLGDIEVAP